MKQPRSLQVIGITIVALLMFPVSGATLQQKPPESAPRVLKNLQDSFVEISEKAMPTVVHLTSERLPLKNMQDKMNEDLFKMFPFPPHIAPDQFRALAAGSGVIVDKRGYILTNNHLVDNSELIKVKLSDPETGRSKEYDGKVMGRDPATDLAVVKIEPDQPLPEARFGDSTQLKVGDWAIAIGDPFGFEKTVTVGVISGLGRSGFPGPLKDVRYQNFIQTDASINPGNSGGPLLNINGEVIGINTFIQAAGTGLGFAIPSAMALEVYQQLVEHGEVIRGFLGVQIGDLDEGLAEALKVPDLNGALVEQVIPDSPAAVAGLRHGDVVRAVDGQHVETSKMLQQLIAHKKPGQMVELKVLREGQQKTFAVELVKFPTKLAAMEPIERKTALGLAVEELPAEMRQAGMTGVIVDSVVPGSPADRSGLAQGDIILEVNMKEVNDVRTFQQVLASLQPGQWVSFYVKRGDVTLYRAVKIPVE
ncbi:MAG: Do family serine endopeptidase [Candidatus Abyssobacteria bacterium SURF_5]|uniref:Do family serine endopeptidase n=1 Tax=Abyssobacteria bacterium (strain SURF_5) TaxID=2093360 RepID=A0A3A4NPF4_ABYX5|nr:MAG: Do family serine endopeptidase [Candidatus Abyssubacteria bacterium SURF_5]